MGQVSRFWLVTPSWAWKGRRLQAVDGPTRRRATGQITLWPLSVIDARHEGLAGQKRAYSGQIRRRAPPSVRRRRSA
jgi:hypothetical protein